MSSPVFEALQGRLTRRETGTCGFLKDGEAAVKIECLACEANLCYFLSFKLNSGSVQTGDVALL